MLFIYDDKFGLVNLGTTECLLDGAVYTIILHVWVGLDTLRARVSLDERQ